MKYNQFFRSFFPYQVSISDRTVTVFNRCPSPIFMCEVPRSFSWDNLVKLCAGSHSGAVQGNTFYIYNDKSNPVNNKDGFDSNLLVSYFEKLQNLVSLLRDSFPLPLYYKISSFDSDAPNSQFLSENSDPRIGDSSLLMSIFLRNQNSISHYLDEIESRL